MAQAITRARLEAERAELQNLEREQWAQLNQTLGALRIIEYYLQEIAEGTDFGNSEVEQPADAIGREG